MGILPNTPQLFHIGAVATIRQVGAYFLKGGVRTSAMEVMIEFLKIGSFVTPCPFTATYETIAAQLTAALFRIRHQL